MKLISPTRDQVDYLKEVGINTDGLPPCAANPAPAKDKTKAPIHSTTVTSRPIPAGVKSAPTLPASPAVPVLIATKDSPPLGLLIFIGIIVFLLIMSALHRGG